MTQVFNPFLEKVAAKNLQNKTARQSGMHMRMCWTCQIEKPLKGGVFPGRVSNKTTPVERFRCADCTQKLLDKRAAQKIE